MDDALHTQPSFSITQQMADHDLLVTANTKLSQLSVDIKDIKDGLNLRVLNIENKIAEYDKILAEYPPQTLTVMLKMHDQWIHDFKLTYRFIVAFAVGIASIITFLLTAVFHLSQLFGK